MMQAASTALVLNEATKDNGSVELVTLENRDCDANSCEWKQLNALQQAESCHKGWLDSFTWLSREIHH